MEFEETEETRVRDLFKQGQLPLRPVPAKETVDRLMLRMWRRPVGCSARLYMKFPIDDPFKRPSDPDPEGHRTVYAAGRFVRLRDEAQPKSELDKMREAAQAQPKPQRIATPDRPVHSKSVNKPAPEPPTRRTPPVPTRPPEPAPRKAAPEPERAAAPQQGNAAAPRRATSARPAAPKSGRIRTAPARGRKPVVGGKPPGGRPLLPVRPDIDEVRGAAAPAPPPKREPPRRAAPPPTRPEPEPEAPKSLLDDPRFTGRGDHSPAPARDKWRDQVKPPPEPIAAPTPTPTPKPKPKPTPKPAPKAPAATAKPAPPPPTTGQADSLKHELAGGRPGGGKALQGNAVVRRRMAPPEPEPEPTRATGEPLSRKPPLMGGGGGGGLDDLFGGASEGRVRVGKAQRKSAPEVRPAAPKPAAPAPPKTGEADSLQHDLAGGLPGGGRPLEGNAVVRRRAAPPEPEPEPVDPKKPISRKPPSTGGGLDDLFGGASEGRVRMGRAKPKK